MLEPYLEISRRRFGDRLTITVRVDDEAGRACVPFFILQPLVENALHHGISSHAGPGSIEIAAHRIADRLIVSVVDDGPGIVVPDAGRGIGLANTKARLQEMYDGGQVVELGRRPEGGFRVQLTIPFRVSNSETSLA